MELSDLIFDRISSFLPEILDGGVLVGISPEWRFLHYELGGFQAAHVDGREKSISVKGSDIPQQVESRLTIQMYLNDHDVDLTGGELTFEKVEGSVTTKYPFRPRAGDCVVFFQEDNREDYESLAYIHTAEEEKSGHKYAMRSMVEYIWRTTAAPPSILTAPASKVPASPSLVASPASMIAHVKLDSADTVPGASKCDQSRLGTTSSSHTFGYEYSTSFYESFC